MGAVQRALKRQAAHSWDVECLSMALSSAMRAPAVAAASGASAGTPLASFPQLKGVELDCCRTGMLYSPSRSSPLSLALCCAAVRFSRSFG